MMETEYRDPSGNYTCSCSLSFPSYLYLKQHQMHECESKKSPIPVLKSGGGYQNEDKAGNQLENKVDESVTYKSEKKFIVCKQCGMSVLFSSLNRHNDLHSDNPARTHICRCSCKFLSNVSIGKHQKSSCVLREITSTGDHAAKSTSLLTAKATVESMKFSRPVQDPNIKSMLKIDDNVKANEGEVLNKKVSNHRKRICEKCGISIFTANLHYHEKLHSNEKARKFVCSCSCKFLTESSLGTHRTKFNCVKRQNINETHDRIPLQITVTVTSGDETTTKKNIKKTKPQHKIQKMKKDEGNKFKIKVCGQCGLSFISTNLKQHMILHSDDPDRKYVCPCSCKFLSKSSLSVHKKYHCKELCVPKIQNAYDMSRSNFYHCEKEFCKECGNSVVLMSRHVILHSNDPARKFVCKCSCKFLTFRSLQRHKSTCEFDQISKNLPEGNLRIQTNENTSRARKSISTLGKREALALSKSYTKLQMPPKRAHKCHYGIVDHQPDNLDSFMKDIDEATLGSIQDVMGCKPLPGENMGIIDTFPGKTYSADDDFLEADELQMNYEEEYLDGDNDNDDDHDTESETDIICRLEREDLLLTY